MTFETEQKLSDQLRAEDDEKWSRCLDATHAENYQSMLELCWELQSRGDPRGAYMLGIAYENGLGVDEDLEKSAGWLSTAANRGHAEAAYLLSLDYAEGSGVPKDENKALHLLEAAAQGGCLIAQTKLGDDALSGDGMPQDTAKGHYWLRKASSSGYGLAFKRLGLAHLTGEGTEQNLLLAYLHLSLAHRIRPSLRTELTDGLEPALNRGQKEFADEMLLLKPPWYLAHLKEFGPVQAPVEEDHGDKDLSLAWDAILDLEFETASKLLKPCLEMNDAQAAGLLATMHHFGLGIPVDYNGARVLYEEAASYEIPGVLVGLGHLYLEGHGVDKNFRKAEELFQTAAKHGMPHAKHQLALMSMKGEGCPSDYNRAKRLLEEAADQGHIPSAHELGAIHYRPNHSEQNQHEAERWWWKAAEAGYPQAQFGLGMLYYWGGQVSKDYVMSWAFFDLAERFGSNQAAEFKGVVEKKLSSAALEDARELAGKLFDWKA